VFFWTTLITRNEKDSHTGLDDKFSKKEKKKLRNSRFLLEQLLAKLNYIIKLQQTMFKLFRNG